MWGRKGGKEVGVGRGTVSPAGMRVMSSFGEAAPPVLTVQLPIQKKERERKIDTCLCLSLSLFLCLPEEKQREKPDTVCLMLI